METPRGRSAVIFCCDNVCLHVAFRTFFGPSHRLSSDDKSHTCSLLCYTYALALHILIRARELFCDSMPLRRPRGVILQSLGARSLRHLSL